MLLCTILCINTALLNNVTDGNSHMLVNMLKAKRVERLHCVEKLQSFLMLNVVVHSMNIELGRVNTVLLSLLGPPDTVAIC